MLILFGLLKIEKPFKFGPSFIKTNYYDYYYLHLGPTDKRDRRPLHYAAYGNHADVVRLLLARGADVDAIDKDHYTALHAAAAAGAVIVVQQLLEAEADIMATNVYGNTPIHTG